jgi:hypothetical protein
LKKSLTTLLKQIGTRVTRPSNVNSGSFRIA